jgi:hypothetical protein
MMEVQLHTAPGHQVPVAFNVNWTNGWTSDELSLETILEVIAEHEAIRIRTYWDEKLLRKSNNGDWLAAFDTRQAPAGVRPPAHFLSSAMQAQLGCPFNGKELQRHARSLTPEEQRVAVVGMRPNDRTGLATVLRDSMAAYAPDLRAMAQEVRSPEAFVAGLVNGLRTKTTPLYHAPRYMELLTLLWSRNLFLFPFDLRTWTLRSKWAALRDAAYAQAKAPLVEDVTHALKGTKTEEFQGWSYSLLASTTLQSVEDLSLSLIQGYEDELLSNSEGSVLKNNALHCRNSMVTRVAQLYRLLFNKAHPAHAIERTRTPKRVSRGATNRGDGTFEWLATLRPDLSEWASLFRLFVSQRTTARIDGQIVKLNRFADYLCSLESPPATPMAVLRNQHIFDATRRCQTTYIEYLRATHSDEGGLHTLLSKMREFFDWHADQLLASGSPEATSFKNPVLASDRIKGKSRADSQTSRNALPSYILEELKLLLTEDDFAFSKTFKHHYHRVIDAHTGQPVRVWFPAMTVCLYAMLEAPVRGHQARWLDSGELDEKVLDSEGKKLAPNPFKGAKPGRREFALRLQHDALRKADWLGLWVNTNKTAFYDSTAPGYCIPYVSDTLAKQLLMVRDWQHRYMPPMAAPIAYYADKHSLEERKRLDGKGPQVTPLFRDPNARKPGKPIAPDRLASFYTRALAEVQERIKRKHGHELRLVERGEDGRLKWLVDLHSLRVSGITAMIESGVPLEVVSQFVAGHATLVMTLHYLKYSPLKLRAVLEEAHQRSMDNMDFVGSEVFMDNLDTFAPYMLGQEGPGVGASMNALRQKTGIISITSEGICPGTSCSTGGPADSAHGNHGPVPGGPRCGLCRYWVTGPAHLLGQVAAVNNLAYVIRKKGLEVASLNDERLDAEDAGDQKRARQLRDRVDVLNRELAVDVEEWAARYRYAEQSVAQLDEYLEAKAAVRGEGLTVPLLTAGTASELKVTLEEAHEFALLDQITQTSEFVTGFRNRAAEFEKQAILSKMLDANGIKPFLLSLSDEQAREAGNLLSALILQQVRTQELGAVLQGSRKLSDFPQLAKTVQALTTAKDKGQLLAIRNSILALEDEAGLREIEYMEGSF